MKTLKYIILSVFSAGLLLGLSSCGDMLDIDQHSVSPIDSYYQTDDEAEEGIVAVYCAVRSLDASMNGSPQVMAEFLGDDAWVGGGSHYDGSYYMLGDYTFGTDFSYISTMYSALYTIIYRANVVLENVTGDSDVMKRAVAEARVFRAFANFYLVAYWGSAPLVDHTLEESEYMQGNSTAEELWAFIEDDLTTAINSGDLTEKSSSTDLTYRITKQYAQALLGKSYVYQKKYSEACTVFDSVINSGLYELATGSDYEGFGTPAVGVNVESLFEIRNLNDISNFSDNNSSLKWTCLGLRAEKYSYESNAPFAKATFGYMQPTKDLYDAFVAVEGEDGYRLNHSVITLAQLQSNYGTSPNQEITDNEGYFCWKYRILADYWASYFYANNWNIMRYAEVLLLAAEANVNAGNSSKAVEYINLIRNRAQAPTLSSVTMDDIKTESRLELCFEGHRFMNLIRWGDAASALAYKGKENPALQTDGSVTWTSYNSSGYGFQTGKHELFPFPADEVAVNPNITQNPGW